MTLGPQFDPKTSEGLATGTPIMRGEKRYFVPTVAVPDPSADPIRALREHMTGNWIFSGGDRIIRSNMGEDDVESVGAHWTLESEGPMLPRFGRRDYEGRTTVNNYIEGGVNFQRGVPMSRDERLRVAQTALSERRGERRPDRNDRAFRDLSGDRQAGGQSPDDNAAKPFVAQVIWHGRHNPAGVGSSDVRSSPNLREVSYEPGTPLHIVGASLHIAKPGEELANPWEEGALQTIQFKRPVQMRVGRSSASAAVANRIAGR